MHHKRLILTSLFVLFLLPISFAQNIKTAKDSALFIECSQLPAAAPQYTLSFTASALDINTPPTEETEKPSESLEELENKLEKTPNDADLAMNLAHRYRAANDEQNYMAYLEYAYKIVYKKYEEHRDSFDIVTQLTALLQEGKNIEGLLSVWNQYVMDQPRDARGLTQFAIQLSIQGEIQKAKHFTEQAYQIDPTSSDVYLAAMMCEFTSTILKLSEIISQQGDDNEKNAALMKIEIDAAFFDKAIAANAPPAAQMSKDAAQMLVIFYRTILQYMDKKIGKEVIDIKPTSADSKLLKEMEKRAKKQIKDKVNNLYFAYKVLCTVEILKGNPSKAVDYWTKSGAFLAKDVDILRLLSFAHFLKLDFPNAILYLEKKLLVEQNYDDSYALGRFYAYSNNLEKAFEIFEATRKINPSDRRAICAKTSILFQQKKFDAALAIIADFPNNITDNVEAFHINYFKAVCTLANGDMNEAYQRLKAIHADSDYKKDAEKLLAHFFKPDEKD